jgi:hypothetical protein
VADVVAGFLHRAVGGAVTILPGRLDDWIAEDNPLRVIDMFVDELDLAKLGFEGAEPAATG